jgi:transcriptional regulator with XRE-family HTH domain
MAATAETETEIESRTVSAALRRAILEDGSSVSDLAMRAGVEQGVISRYLRGDGLPLSAVDGLAQALGLELVPAVPPPVRSEPTLADLARMIAEAGRRLR